MSDPSSNVVQLFNPPEVLDAAWAAFQEASAECGVIHAEEGYSPRWHEALHRAMIANEHWLVCWRRDRRTYARAPF